MGRKSKQLIPASSCTAFSTHKMWVHTSDRYKKYFLIVEKTQDLKPRKSSCTVIKKEEKWHVSICLPEGWVSIRIFLKDTEQCPPRLPSILLYHQAISCPTSQLLLFHIMRNSGEQKQVPQTSHRPIFNNTQTANSWRLFLIFVYLNWRVF